MELGASSWVTAALQRRRASTSPAPGCHLSALAAAGKALLFDPRDHLGGSPEQLGQRVLPNRPPRRQLHRRQLHPFVDSREGI